MPGSYNRFNSEIQSIVQDLFPNPSNIHVLDVGAGAGKYRELLKNFPHMDALEVWIPYIEEYRLDHFYENVWNVEASKFGFYDEYDLVILGDVLEHMDVKSAQRILKKCDTCTVLVAIPYQYEQGIVNGNPYEKHLQPDLTPTVVSERYPNLELLVSDDNYGIYIQHPDNSLEKRNRPIPSEIMHSKLIDNEDARYSVPPAKTIAIAVPTHSGLVNMHCAASLYKIGAYFTNLGMNNTLIQTDGARISNNRNKLVAEFMRSGKDVLVFLDSDMDVEPKYIHEIAISGKPICGIVVRKKSEDIRWNFNPIEGEARFDNPFLEVQSVGTGILAVHRKVFELMFKEYSKFKVSNISIDNKPDPFMYVLFQEGFDMETGEDYGEDTTFCLRWRMIGGSIWVHTLAKAGHVGSKVYRGDIADLVRKSAKSGNGR